jgi:uncharacterized protein (DUF488 family)
VTTIHTIGHGNRPAEEFISLLQQSRICCLVDVRAFPASRRHPHFARAALERSLREAGIGYRWEGDALGGRRRPRADSPNVALRNASFRAYADHMMQPEFAAARDDLIEAASRESIAIMCAERLPWQCHRYLISDALTARAVTVLHLVSVGTPQQHALSRLARMDGEVLIYDRGEQPTLNLD